MRRREATPDQSAHAARSKDASRPPYNRAAMRQESDEPGPRPVARVDVAPPALRGGRATPRLPHSDGRLIRS
jgi:hypothetical protein